MGVKDDFAAQAEEAEASASVNVSAEDGELSWKAEHIDLNDLPADDPDLLANRLVLGGKMIISGPTKADKSWLAINIAESIAVGEKVLGIDTLKGRVFYVNMELKRTKFLKRLKAVANARGFNLDEVNKNLDVIHMRGFYKGPGAFKDVVSRELDRMLRENGEKYVAIVIDPIYKINFSENDAQEVGRVCEAIDHFCEKYDLSVIEVHHHSKGNKADRAAIDRSSGSGVLSRDPDCILDCLEVFPSDPESNPLGEKVRAFIFEWSFRDHPPIEPQRVIYKWPLHMLDADGVTSDWEAVKSKGTEGAKARAKVKKAEIERDFALAQIEIAAYLLDNGYGCDDGIPAKEAAELAGMKESRKLIAAFDKYDSKLLRYAKKPGKKEGTYSKDNYVFLRAGPTTDSD